MKNIWIHKRHADLEVAPAMFKTTNPNHPDWIQRSVKDKVYSMLIRLQKQMPTRTVEDALNRTYECRDICGNIIPGIQSNLIFEIEDTTKIIKIPDE